MKIGVYISLLCTAVALISHAAVAPRQRYTFDVNQQQKPTQLKAVQLSSWEYLFKFNENRVAKDLTDVDRVLFDFSTTNLSWTSTVTGSVFLATNGQILVPFTPAQLNTNGSFRWRVEAIDDGAGKTLAFGFGTLTIERDWGASTTAAAFVTSTNIDWASVGIYANTLSNGPYRAGTNISFGLTGNGAVTINSSAISAAYTNWVAVSGGNLTLAGTGRSGSNTIGLTTAAIQGAAASITNALNTSIIALNAASNTFEADINALVAVSNAPTLQSVGETSATATGSRYTNGLRLVEFASGGAEDYAARFENTHTALEHTVVKIGAGQAPYKAAIWASNKVNGVVARIATDSGDGLIVESTLGKGELLSSTAPLYIESPDADMFIRGAHGANRIALDVGRLGNTNRVKLGSLNYALDTTQGNSRIKHVLELDKVTFVGVAAEAFSFKPEYQPADGSVMTYDATKHHWTNQLTINQSSKSDGDSLVYRSAQGEYTNEATFTDATNAAIIAAAAAVALGYESGTSTNHTLWTETHSVSGSIKMLHASVIKSGSDKIAYDPQLGFLKDLDGTNSIRLHERQLTDTAGAIVGDWAGPRTFSTVSGLTNNVPNPAAASSNNNAATTKWVRDLVGLQNHSGGGGGSATSAQYTVTFRHANLAAGVLTVDHDLDSDGQLVQVFRTQATGYDEIISPDAVSISNANTVLVDLTTFGSFAWTGRVTVAGSSVTAALGNYLQSAQTNGWDVSGGGGDTTTNMYASLYFKDRLPSFPVSTFGLVNPDGERSDIHNIYDPVVGAITPPETGVWINVWIDANLDGASGIDNGGWTITTNDGGFGGTKYFKLQQYSHSAGSVHLAAAWFHTESAISNYPIYYYHQYASPFNFVTGLVSQADSDTPFRMIVKITKEQP